MKEEDGGVGGGSKQNLRVKKSRIDRQTRSRKRNGERRGFGTFEMG